MSSPAQALCGVPTIARRRLWLVDTPTVQQSDRELEAVNPDLDLTVLVRRSAAGDRDALATLYDSTCSLVHGLALRILREPYLAEDVVIEVFSQAWSSAGTFDPCRGSVTTWLLTLTRSRAIDMLRSRGRFPAVEALDVAAHVDRESVNLEEVVELSERSRIVRRALLALSPDQRLAIELAYFRGMSHSAIAHHLKQPLGTIKTRIRSGMLVLRDHLEAIAGDPS